MSYSDFDNYDYFDGLTQVDINRELGYLQKHLPKKCTLNNYQLSHKLLGINSIHIRESALQENLQKIADKMREHLKIERFIKILTLKEVKAGKFERIDNLNCIYINGDLSEQNYLQKLAILAHEMAHYYLIYQHNILLKDVDQNEFLTEMAAVYIGFGFLLLDGYPFIESVKNGQTRKIKVGYIDIEMVRRAIAKTAKLRKQSPKWIVKKTSFPHNLILGTQLISLQFAYAKAKRLASK